MINKIMHTPIVALKTAAKSPEAETVVHLIRRMFNLPEQASDEDEEAKARTTSNGADS